MNNQMHYLKTTHSSFI